MKLSHNRYLGYQYIYLYIALVTCLTYILYFRRWHVGRAANMCEITRHQFEEAFHYICDDIQRALFICKKYLCLILLMPFKACVIIDIVTFTRFCAITYYYYSVRKGGNFKSRNQGPGDVSDVGVSRQRLENFCVISPV